MLTLRPYQSQCVEAVLNSFGEFQKQLVVAPTGSGKTIIFSHLALSVSGKPDSDTKFKTERVLILAHREELIDQAIQKLHSATGIFADKEKAEFKASLQSDVVVASVQTLCRRLGKWPQDHFGLIIVDEAHHVLADSYQSILAHLSPAKVLGVTATPDRGDKKNLGKYFQNIAFEISLFDLIHQGYLSRISVQSIPIEIDLKGVRSTAGDFNESDVGERLEPWLLAIAEQIKAQAGFRRTLVFLPLCATSRSMVEALKSVGLSAAHIDGNSPDRKEILQDFAGGKYDVLCNAMLLTEGYDDSGIDCVVVLRPTKSRSLFSQMIGRGTRVAPAKSDLLILDFLWLHEQHNLIRPAHLIASTSEQADIMQKMIEVGGAKQMPLDLEGIATEAQAQREKKLQEELAKKAKRQAKTIDAMEFCLSLHVPDLGDEPSTEHEARSVSSGQREMLEKNGIDVDTVTCWGHASKLADMIILRARQDLATPKQVKWLKKFGHPSPHTATFKEASAMLTKRFNKTGANAHARRRAEEKQEMAAA